MFWAWSRWMSAKRIKPRLRSSGCQSHPILFSRVAGRACNRATFCGVPRRQGPPLLVPSTPLPLPPPLIPVLVCSWCAWTCRCPNMLRQQVHYYPLPPPFNVPSCFALHYTLSRLYLCNDHDVVACLLFSFLSFLSQLASTLFSITPNWLGCLHSFGGKQDHFYLHHRRDLVSNKQETRPSTRYSLLINLCPLSERREQEPYVHENIC
jgi:hypothetical protein